MSAGVKQFHNLVTITGYAEFPIHQQVT